MMHLIVPCWTCVLEALIAEVASSAIGASSGLVDSVGVLPAADESACCNERLLVLTGLLLATESAMSVWDFGKVTSPLVDRNSGTATSSFECEWISAKVLSINLRNLKWLLKLIKSEFLSQDNLKSNNAHLENFWHALRKFCFGLACLLHERATRFQFLNFC